MRNNGPNGRWDEINNQPIFRKGAIATRPSINYKQSVAAQRMIAPPASFEEIAKACVVLCSVTDKKPPCGSGVFVGVGQEGERPRIFLLTAAHVAQRVNMGTPTNAVAFIIHRPNENTDLRKTVAPDGNGWLTPGGLEDIAMVDVTSAFGRMVDEARPVSAAGQSSQWCVTPTWNIPRSWAYASA